MKKKSMSIALMAALIISAAGCGEKAPAVTTTAKTEAAATTAAAAATTAKEDTAEETTTTAAETTTEATTEAPPREIKNITKYNSFKNGTLFFEISNTGYVYDVLENKMYDYDANELKSVQYACGKLVMTNYNGENKITNLETMETYDAELFESYAGFGGGPRLDTYNPVYSVKEDFDGNVYSFGILGSNGEWVLPMSTEYAVCDLLKSNKYLYANTATSSFATLGVGKYDRYFYNYKTNEMIELDNPQWWAFIDNYVLLSNYNSIGSYSYSVYNTKTKETTKLDGEYLTFERREHCIVLQDLDKNLTILGSNGNILNYDLSDYNIKSNERILDATDDYIAFVAENTDGDTYTGLKNQLCKRNNRQNFDHTKIAAKQGDAEERPDAGCGIKR